MKRTCFGCKALSNEVSSPIHYTCDLDFKINHKEIAPCIFEPIPAEECPKPRTIKEIHRAIGQLSKKKKINRHTSESRTRRYYCR